MKIQTTKLMLVLIAVLTAAACTDRSRQPAAAEPEIGAELQQQLQVNDRNAAYLARVQAELESRVSADGGSLRVNDPGSLSAEARELVTLAREHGNEFAPAGIAASAAPGRSGCFAWGCRIAVSHKVWEGVKEACRPGRATTVGCKQAIKGFIASLGLTGWSATVAPWIVPAYWAVMNWACSVSSHRGFYINVTWALVTVISPM